MKSLVISPAWDAAGCSFRHAEAINQLPDWEARHWRTINTYDFPSDLTPQNYNRDQFVSLVEEADVLHFCSATHDWKDRRAMKWGFDWAPYLKTKVKIFHDYCSFPGTWEERFAAKDYWNKKSVIGYDAIFTSIPQAAANVYNGGVYIPDIVDEKTPQFTPPANRDYSILNLGHWPTGGGNNKNTDELKQAVEIANKSVQLTLGISGGSNGEVLRQKRLYNLGFDALWRGYHGMTTVENLAMGIPTMCRMDDEFKKRFAEHFQTDEFPFEHVVTVNDIVNVIAKFANDLDLLKVRAEEVRNFMVTRWSYKNVAETIVSEYGKLLS